MVMVFPGDPARRWSAHLRRMPGGLVGSLGTACVERHGAATGHGAGRTPGAMDRDAM